MAKDTINWFDVCKELVAKYDVLAALLITMALVIVSTWLGIHNNMVVPFFANPHFRYLSPNPLRFLSNWDGPDYIAIAKHGYRTLLHASFFPLYPLLIRGVYYLVRSYLMSALLISWGSLVGAIYFYIKIVKRLGIGGKESSRLLAVAPFILFPTGVFFIATYTESLFSLLALASLYMSLQKRYVWAGVLLFFVNLTHIPGIFVIIMDALVLWEERLPLRKITITVGMGTSGIAAYMVFLFARYHDALAFLKSQTQIHGWLGNDYYYLIRSTSFFNVLFSVLLIASAAYYWRTRKSFAVYSLLFLAIPIVGAQWGGFNRYVLVAFPVPLMLYEVFKERPRVYTFVIVASTVLWTYTLLQYAAGYVGS